MKADGSNRVSGLGVWVLGLCWQASDGAGEAGPVLAKPGLERTGSRGRLTVAILGTLVLEKPTPLLARALKSGTGDSSLETQQIRSETGHPKPETRHPISHKNMLAFALCFFFAACARLGERLQPGAVPAGTPEVQTILADLASNDSAIKNFKATGAFTLSSPDLAAVKTFKDGLIAFRRPADLCVIGRKYLGAAVFRLTCVGSEFLIEFPASHEEPYYRLEGERFQSVPFSVSPSDIAREMFLPESWSELKPREVTLTGYDAAAQRATLVIGPRRSPRRLIEVLRLSSWVVVRGERLDSDGKALAVTTKDDYHDVEGVHFPAYVDAQFPGEETRMTFEMRKVWPNTELDSSLFDIKARAREAGVDLTRPTSEGPGDEPRKKRARRR